MDDDAGTMLRGEVTYYRLEGNTDATYLETETDTAPLKKWQANTVFQKASDAENKPASTWPVNAIPTGETAMLTTPERNKHGIVAWYVGAKRKF